jgi:hypothetical protein
MFLDTARLGRMSPRALAAHTDLGRLAAAEGASPRFVRFLRAGFDGPCDADRYPGLACWRGVTPLKADLMGLAGGGPLPALLAARSATLMRLAARFLCVASRNVLTTDLAWPPYLALLTDEAVRRSRVVTVVPLRDLVFTDQIDADGVLTLLAEAYHSRGCDGVFLPAVSSDGVRLPVADLVAAVSCVRRPRMVVVDGAQEYCHAPVSLAGNGCDLYLTGCQKWLGAYHPLGIGLCGRADSAGLVTTLVDHVLRSGEIDDPLLRFTTDLGRGEPGGGNETVGLTPLFTCQAAAVDAAESGTHGPLSFSARLANLARATGAIEPTGWVPRMPAVGLRSGILIGRSTSERVRATPGERIRGAFAGEGVQLSAYDGGTIRLSMPNRPWSGDEVELLVRAAGRVAA